MANTAFLLMGSNIDKEHNLPTAVSLLREKCLVVAVSSVYETAPVGLPEQPDFLNAAVQIVTDLDPAALKAQILVPLEETLSRQRQADKNAPRTIDVDLILFNDEVIESGHRRIPDPDLHRFLHVAVPVAELAPDMLHPETGERLAQIAQRLKAEAMANNARLPYKRTDIEVRGEK